MDAVRSRYPGAFIQFEDFSSDVAYKILNYYREVCMYVCMYICMYRDSVPMLHTKSSLTTARYVCMYVCMYRDFSSDVAYKILNYYREVCMYVCMYVCVGL